jgi:hypothetical protein|mmetsp:Transcript_17119/g.2829  ORF Transcript_17119/g.2829 Transcript_17119/m.2829 type:complete len:162 (+) Transcript_17119:113-598(+)
MLGGNLSLKSGCTIIGIIDIVLGFFSLMAIVRNIQFLFSSNDDDMEEENVIEDLDGDEFEDLDVSSFSVLVYILLIIVQNAMNIIAGTLGIIAIIGFRNNQPLKIKYYSVFKRIELIFTMIINLCFATLFCEWVFETCHPFVLTLLVMTHIAISYYFTRAV